MFGVLDFYLTPRVLSDEPWGLLFIEWARNNERRKLSEFGLHDLIEFFCSKSESIKLFNVVEINLSCEWDSLMEVFFNLKNLFFRILIRFGYDGNQVEVFRKPFHYIYVGVFDARASQEVQATVNPPIVLRFFLVVYPLGESVLFDFPQILVLLVLGESGHVDKINAVAPVVRILLIDSEFVSDLPCAGLDVRLVEFPLFLFETADECRLSCVFSPCNQNIQDVLFEALMSFEYLNSFLFLDPSCWLFARLGFLNFNLGVSFTFVVYGIGPITFLLVAQLNAFDFLAVEISAFFIYFVHLYFGFEERPFWDSKLPFDVSFIRLFLALIHLIKLIVESHELMASDMTND